MFAGDEERNRIYGALIGGAGSGGNIPDLVFFQRRGGSIHQGRGRVIVVKRLLSEAYPGGGLERVVETESQVRALYGTGRRDHAPIAESVVAHQRQKPVTVSECLIEAV